MEIVLGGGKKSFYAYGFDDVSLVPSAVTVDPDDVQINFLIGKFNFDLPILASAMDGVVDAGLAIEVGRLGGLAVLNLEGLQTRYEKPSVALRKIIQAPSSQVVKVIQKVYSQPLREELIERRVKEIKAKGVPLAVSLTPAKVERFANLAISAGADILVVQSTVTTAKYISSRSKALSFPRLCRSLRVPVIAGNCVTYPAAWELMATGISAILVGVGPGAACTTRRVLGVGIPQVTAIAEVAFARDEYYKKNKKYILVIADGGMNTGGDIAKAIASGADAVMLGGALVRAREAPGRGYHWGMATSHLGLPRGTRIKVGVKGSLKEVLFGPAKTDDGSLNLIGALRQTMGMCGARNIKEMQGKELVIAPSVLGEGKSLQRAQSVGMGKDVQ